MFMHSTIWSRGGRLGWLQWIRQCRSATVEASSVQPDAKEQRERVVGLIANGFEEN
jgi:hypothetical protein